MNTLGPSPAEAWGLVKAVDGVTVSSATWSWSIAEGDRRANSDSRKAVSMSKGAR